MLNINNILIKIDKNVARVSGIKAGEQKGSNGKYRLTGGPVFTVRPAGLILVPARTRPAGHRYHSIYALDDVIELK